MKWIKGHTSELDSTLYQEADIEIRYVFYALRLLAGRENKSGKIKYLNDAHLGRLLNTKTEIIEKSLKFLKSTKRIKIWQTSEGYLLRISKWNIYQGDTRSKTESQNTQKDAKTESQTHTQRRGEERRGDKKRIEEKRGEEDHPKNQFINILKSIHPYPFNEDDDGRMFDFCSKEYPDVDLIDELKKKIQRWEDHPEELKGARDPRTKLFDWFGKEQAFQSKRRTKEFGEE